MLTAGFQNFRDPRREALIESLPPAAARRARVREDARLARLQRARELNALATARAVKVMARFHLREMA